MDSFHLTQLFGGADTPRSSLSSGEDVVHRPLLQAFMRIVNEIRSAIATAKRELASEFHRLQSLRDSFRAAQKQRRLAFQQEKVTWTESECRAESQFLPENEIVEVDIGGQYTVTTTLRTLRRFPESKLAAITGEPDVYYKGKLFIDRDPGPFRALLRYLRSGQWPDALVGCERDAFQRELEHWEISANPEDRALKASPVAFDPQWCAPTLLLGSRNQTVRKKAIANGIVLVSRPLTDEQNAIEFHVETSDRQVKLFLGLVDRNEYTLQYLTSPQWREAPSSYYWNVQSHEIVKTDRRGHPKTIKDYGCACLADSPCTLGILFDAKLHTVCFTQQGISQGTAFTDVPVGLYPAVDLWFEAGSVTIVQSAKSESTTETSF